MSQRLQAFKFELMPNGEQWRDSRRSAGARRFVFNKALELQNKRRQAGEKHLSFAALCKWLTGLRAEIPWLEAVHSQVLQQALKDLEAAFTNFFEGRAEYPTFKKKGRSGDSFRFPQLAPDAVDSINGRIKLPKLGWMRYRKSRDVPGEVRSATVSMRAGRWYVSILTKREVEIPKHTGDIVGMDMGVKKFAAFSDGTFIEPANSFKRHEKALAKAQRRLSRKVKFSNNWQKEKAKVQKIQARIGNVRNNFLHQHSCEISNNHAIVVGEDLQVRNMSKSASGTVDAPGKSVRAKSGLNRSILDQGWGEWRRQLEYKLAWKGGEFAVVPPHNTSRECPECHHVSADNRKTQAEFICVACGFEDNADTVGAVNVLSRWLKRDERQDTAHACAGHEQDTTADAAEIAWQVNGARGRQQQEPAEETVSE